MLFALCIILVPPLTLADRGLVMRSRSRSYLGVKVVSVPLFESTKTGTCLRAELTIESSVSTSSSTLSKQAGLAFR